MTRLLKVALLEDNQNQLKARVNDIRDHRLAEIVVFATQSEEFLEKVAQESPDALFLDIDLRGDSTNGLEVAYDLKLPVLFLSGHNGTYLKDIERLKRDFDLPVEHLTKPIMSDEFVATARRFLKDVEQQMYKNMVHLRFKGKKEATVPLNNVVFIESAEGNEGKSNNKRIHFTDRPPEMLVDFSFSKMSSAGLNPNVFITTHQSYRVNVNKINGDPRSGTIEVTAMNEDGRRELKSIPVSENYKSSAQQSVRQNG